MTQFKFTRGDIENLVLAQPEEERIRLMLLLRSSLPCEPSVTVKARELARRRAESILVVVEGAAGMRMNPRSRHRPHHVIRMVAAYCMGLEGIGEVVSGEVLGKDHATIHYLRKAMRSALEYPEMYSDVVDLLERVKRELGPVKETTDQPFKKQ